MLLLKSRVAMQHPMARQITFCKLISREHDWKILRSSRIPTTSLKTQRVLPELYL